MKQLFLILTIVFTANVSAQELVDKWAKISIENTNKIIYWIDISHSSIAYGDFNFNSATFTASIKIINNQKILINNIKNNKNEPVLKNEPKTTYSIHILREDGELIQLNGFVEGDTILFLKDNPDTNRFIDLMLNKKEEELKIIIPLNLNGDNQTDSLLLHLKSVANSATDYLYSGS